jgi:hypothetical protein
VVELRRPTSAPLSQTPTDDVSRASTAELLLSCDAASTPPRDTCHESWDDSGGGLDPHGDWPAQASQV